MKLIQPRAALRVYSGSIMLNGGAEQGDASPLYWNSSGANATTESTEVYTGSRAFKVVAGADTWTSDFFDCEEDTTYTLRLYLKAASAAAKFTINYYDEVGVIISSEDVYFYTGTKDFTESIY